MKKEQRRKISKEEKGITLIALVITIIILLILAGVTLNAALSENGLFKKAKYAAEEYNNKAIEEQLQLILAEQEIDAASSNGKADITDVLEEMAEGEEITEDDINEFNDLLEKYGSDEKVKPLNDESKLSELDPNGIYVQTENIEELTVTQSLEGTGTGTYDESGNLTTEKSFTGVYNGNGKHITNLNINATTPFAGMFGINEGTIKNVIIDNCTVTTSYGNAGAIAGINRGLIENCTVSRGTVSGRDFDSSEGGAVMNYRHIGGICGENEGGTIRGCSNGAAVDSENIIVGGICGWLVGGVVEDCTNNGAISGTYQVGGIVGRGDTSTLGNETRIIRCVNERGHEVQANSYDGGVLGYTIGNVNIEECVNLGNVIANEHRAGGIVGNCGGTASVKFCRNEGNITCKLNVSGGIIGALYNSSSVEMCYDVGDVSDTGENGIKKNGKIVGDLDGEGSCANDFYVSNNEVDGIGDSADNETGCTKVEMDKLKKLEGVEGLEEKFKVDETGGYPKLNWEK